MITADLIRTILQQFGLALDGEHGIGHWARVLENGRRLAPLTGANLQVVELFAVLHDARRISDDHDVLHGIRAAHYCTRLRGTLLTLSDRDFGLLFEACAFHVDGRTRGDITMQTCWDADRLDYARGGTPLDTRYLCTAAARDPAILAWATQRSLRCEVPSLVADEWAVPLGAL